MNKYEDIIDLPHHISKKRPPMSMADRAAQFSPFAALTGYDETIKENDRYLDEKIDISEEEKEILDRKINMITNIPNKRPSLTITYFKKDDKKSGGRYITKSCAIKKIDMIDRVISFIDDTKIALDDIIDIEDVSFDDL